MLLIVGCLTLFTSGCARPRATESLPPTSAAPSVVGATMHDCPRSGGWSCDQQRRFVAVAPYLAPKLGQHGYLGVVFRDRATGGSWSFGATTHAGWTASTVKLAIATDLLRRARAGEITLDAADHHDLDTMLNFSDEGASDRLWKKFGGEDMLARFRSEFGMSGLHFVPGFTRSAYWGFVKCTTDDLAVLMNYVLTKSAAADRDYLTAAMRGVAPNQRWGVWAAGSDQRPGNKDGWSEESDPYGKHWVTSTVGFAGPGERYLVAVTYQLDPSGTLSDGVHTVSDVVAVLFGKPIPAPVTMPMPDG